MKTKKSKVSKSSKTIRLPFIEVRQAKRSFMLTVMPAEVLVRISYVAVRRESQERGAVQRPLNDKRIAKISTFAQKGGDFPVDAILNWVTPTVDPKNWTRV